MPFVMEELVTVIIPLYNRKHLIRRCVKSVCNQTYKNLEIIVVDDGSTDEPDAVLAELAQDTRVKIIRKPNGGVSSARNAGLDAATGTYVQFVDSDDALVPYATEVAVQAVAANGVDCAVFCSCSMEEMSSASMPTNVTTEVLTDVDCVAEVKQHGGVCVPWNKIFKRDLVGDIRFMSGVSMGEDLIFNLAYLARCRGVAFLPYQVYCYEKGASDSLSCKYNAHCIEDIRAQWNAVRDYLKQAPSEEMEHRWSCFFWTCYLEAVRKLCLKSGYSQCQILKTLKEWSRDEMILSFPSDAVSPIVECRLLRDKHFLLMLAVIRLRYAKGCLLRRFRTKSR